MAFAITIDQALRAALVAMLTCSVWPARAQSGDATSGLPAPAVPPAETLVSLPSWSPLIKRVLPAVVNVSAEIPIEAASAGDGADGQSGPAETPFSDFLRRYFEQHGLPPGTAPLPPATRPVAGSKVMSLGSAFIIDPAGYIVTNNHVVDHATKITVIFQDNSRRSATLVGHDSKIDIALLKVSVRHNLPFLQWGDSNKVEVGDWVMAVGNPFGLGGTVTAGIVSAVGRDLQQGPFDDFLQIDAPINRGNSGGPTFDVTGRVVGINTAIFSPTGGSVGIGFAIPSSIAQIIVQRLRDTGHASHGYLGVSVQQITPEIARALHMDPDRPRGLLVGDVTPDSPAAKAGLQPGDVIEAANGQAVEVSHDISKFVVTAKVGDDLHVVVDRDGKKQTLTLVVGQTPPHERHSADGQDQSVAPGDDSSVQGLWFAALTSDRRREFGLDATVQGVVVGGIKTNSSAAGVGLMQGDVVRSIDRQPVSDPADALRKLRTAAAAGDVLLLVDRRGSSEFIVLPVQGDAAGSN